VFTRALVQHWLVPFLVPPLTHIAPGSDVSECVVS